MNERWNIDRKKKQKKKNSLFIIASTKAEIKKKLVMLNRLKFFLFRSLYLPQPTIYLYLCMKNYMNILYFV